MAAAKNQQLDQIHEATPGSCFKTVQTMRNGDTDKDARSSEEGAENDTPPRTTSTTSNADLDVGRQCSQSSWRTTKWTQAMTWRALGPANMGGRIVDSAVVPSDTSTYWIATGGGGLLKTTNNGATFVHQFDHEATVAVGSVAVSGETRSENGLVVPGPRGEQPAQLGLLTATGSTANRPMAGGRGRTWG